MFSGRGLIFQASKAALLSFYNTLRMELGASISITIVTPGYVESDMSQGKHLSKEGVSTVTPQLVVCKIYHYTKYLEINKFMQECNYVIIKE